MSKRTGTLVKGDFGSLELARVNNRWRLSYTPTIGLPLVVECGSKPEYWLGVSPK